MNLVCGVIGREFFGSGGTTWNFAQSFRKKSVGGFATSQVHMVKMSNASTGAGVRTSPVSQTSTINSSQTKITPPSGPERRRHKQILKCTQCRLDKQRVRIILSLCMLFNFHSFSFIFIFIPLRPFTSLVS